MILEVIEEFFGEELSQGVMDLASSLPWEQLSDLAMRLEEYRERVERRDFGREAAVGDPTFGSDVLFTEGGVQRWSSSLGEVKFFALVCDHTLFPDPLLDWATEMSLDIAIGGPPHDKDRARELAECLLATNAVAPLLRLGALTAVPSAHKYAPNGLKFPSPFARAWTSRWPERDVRLSTLARDPYLRHVLVDVLEVPKAALQQSFTGAEMAADDFLSSWQPEVAKALAAVTGERLEDLFAAAAFREVAEVAGFLPIANPSFVCRHLIRTTSVVLERSSKPHDEVRLRAIASAEQLGLPDVSSLSFGAIAALRADDEVYAELRDAFSVLATHIASTGSIDSYQQLARAVRDEVRDVVKPAHERLLARQRSEHRKALTAGLVSGGAVSLAIRGVSLILPPLRHAKSPIGTAVSKKARQSHDEAAARADVAASLLLSMLPPGSRQPPYT